MNTSPVNKNLFESAIVDAIDSAFASSGDAMPSDEFAVRAVFGLEGTFHAPEATYQRMMKVIMDAAIVYLFDERRLDQGESIDIEKAAQEFLREKLMELRDGTDISRCGVRMAATYEHGDFTYTTSASLAFGSNIRSPFLDTAIEEARRREGYDEANKPMVLIEPPKVEPKMEQVASDGRVITDRDTEIATGDFSDQSGDVEPASDRGPF